MSNLAEKLHELALPAIGEAYEGGYLAALMPAPEGRQREATPEGWQRAQD